MSSLLAHPDRLFIGGVWTWPVAEETAVVIRPDTEEPYLRVALAGRGDVAAAVGAARQAFDEGPWPRLSPQRRGEYVKALAGELRARSADLATLWASQVGVLHSVATAAMPSVADVFELYAGLPERFPLVERRPTKFPRRVGLLAREPVGVVAAIIPWNGPADIIAYKLAPALIAGCTVVLKASVEAPGEAYVFAEAAEAAGLPPGVVNVVTADREVSESLVRDPRVDKVSFTGSTAAGRRIAALCADRIARVTLELGGKSAAVILDDYDLGTAAKALAKAQCFLSGQACAALTRIVVPAGRHDEFVEALAAEYGGMRVGSQFDPASRMGPLATRVQRDRVERYIAAGRAEGAVVATGGGRPADLDTGFFVEPTVFARADNAMTVAREEIFGPVLTVVPAADEADAVRIANDSDFGLNAAVFTTDADRAYRVARELRAGTVGHNGMRVDYGIAFGGFKQSGIGREGGVEGLLPYLETKTIVLDDDPVLENHGA
ncbi:aldehyde dehydrogenase [Pseudonocardia ailaonensis]|uniref:Aldehyde dehydrogenase n=1 Tax=Pseudonocardia ailaonensis TaxID=367279 RepID=A0ABN2MIB7_9PSEU